MKNVVGFYSTRQQAEQVKEDLLKSGVDRDDITIYDREGKHEASLWEDIKSSFGFADDSDHDLYAEAARRGAVAVGVSFDRDDEPAVIIQILQRHNPIDLDTQAAQWRKEGWTGRTTGARSSGTTTAAAATTTAATRPATPAVPAASAQRVQQGSETVPVVEEQLQVGKRAVQAGGVRVHTRVIEKPVQEQVQLREEHVRVERRPVDRPLTSADQPFKERVIEATETIEQPVVAKQARVVEEVNVRKDVNQRTETVRDTVRRTDVQVEQIDTDPKFAPARDFATRFFADNRYKGRSWDEVEPDARRSFEQTNPGKWNEFRDAIRSRYDRDTSRAKANT
jgi:uncharacterized protein (TIGR02271 family)